MAILKILISILIFLLSLSTFASNRENDSHLSKNESLYEVLNDKETKVKYYDKITASNIIQLYKQINNKQIKYESLKNTKSSIYKNSNFELFKDWIGQTEKIFKEKKVQHIRKYCQYLVSQKEVIPLKISLKQQSTSYCYNKYLEILSQNLRQNKYPIDNDLNEIKNNLSVITINYNEDEFYYFLDLLYKKSEVIFDKISNSISEYYIQNQIVPSVELLKHIKISAKLTRLVQLKGIDTNSIYDVFSNRLEKLIDEAFNDADKKENKKTISQKVDYVINFYNLNIEHLPKNESLNKLLSLGKSISRRGYLEISKNIFTTITAQDSKYYENALFELLWVDIVNENYKTAYKTINDLKVISKINNFENSKLKYWIAYTLLKNNINGYQGIMQQIVDSSPLSFYAVMSAKVLQEKLKQSPDQIYKNLLKENKFPYQVSDKNFSSEVLKAFLRLKVWAELDSKTFINLESKNLKQYYISQVNLPTQYQKELYQKELLTYLNAKILFNTKNYLESFKIIYNGLEDNTLQLNYNVLSTLFPRPFWQNIQQNVSGFDPIIALSLIRQESGFNPKARSYVGARGLMQLMPATAKMYKRRLNNHHLEQPNLNIKIGSKYFMDLLNKYDHNLVYALSAYNAGEGRVNHWQNNYLTSDSILHNIENIPFLETRKYVKLIFRNIFFYKLIDSKTQLKDTKHKNQLFNIALGFQQ